VAGLLKKSSSIRNLEQHHVALIAMNKECWDEQFSAEQIATAIRREDAQLGHWADYPLFMACDKMPEVQYLRGALAVLLQYRFDAGYRFATEDSGEDNHFEILTLEQERPLNCKGED
jgi:hypothetical protein